MYKDFLENIRQRQYTKANEIFEIAMMTKVNQTLEEKRKEMVGKMFNGKNGGK